MSEINIIYSEPVGYFPREVREMFFPELEVDSEKYNEIARRLLCDMLEERNDVRLDHPFIYAIVHNKTHLPVFIGVVNQL